MTFSPFLRVGLAVGRGTGPELADIFEQVMHQLARRHSIHLDFHRSSRIYHSYSTLLSEGGDGPEAMSQETVKDADHYQKFCEDEAKNGTRVVFRTAISAQALYLVRQHLEAVKVEHFNLGSSYMLLIRDQAHGFYTGYNHYDISQETVSRTCQFSKAIFHRILSFGIATARKLWGPHGIDTVTMVYKFHLFDGLFHTWSEEWSKAFGIRIEFVQPDTTNRNLLAFGVQGRRLMIAGNEYADIMQVILLDRFGMGVQETTCAENVYLHPKLHGLSEYQTIHGSADDIVGKGIVNPFATIRAAAAILERHGGCSGVEEEVDGILQLLVRKQAVTPDQGGKLSTAEVVNATIQALAAPSIPAPLPQLSPASKSYEMPQEQLAFLGKKSALLVIDFQNDFVTNHALGNRQNGHQQNGNQENGHSTNTEDIARNISKVIDFARKNQQEVIFLRFAGDAQYQTPSWRHRNHTLKRPEHCLEGSWGARFFGSVQPANKERVFDKRALYDPFLCKEFEEYVTERGFEHFVLVGLSCDICVDATAKTAFQKGYFVTLVSDCTITLHLPHQEFMKYMRKVYGIRLVSHDRLLKMVV